MCTRLGDRGGESVLYRKREDWCGWGGGGMGGIEFENKMLLNMKIAKEMRKFSEYVIT